MSASRPQRRASGERMAEPTPPLSGPDRFLLGIVAGALGLIVLALAAAALAARAPAPAPPDLASPAGVVQAYVEALRADDVEGAYALLSAGARASVPLDEFRRRLYRPYAQDTSADRVLITPITVAADRAEVQVTISRFTARAAPFSTSTYHRDVTVRLVRENGAWRISQPIEPYAFLF